MPSQIQAGSFEHVSGSFGASVDSVMRRAMAEESTDNLSVIVIGFSNFANLVGGLTAARQ